MIDTDEFVQGYLDGILFTETIGYEMAERASEQGDHFAPDCSLLGFGCDRDSFTLDAVAEIRTECEAFIATNAQDLVEYCDLRGESVRCVLDSFGRSRYTASECAGTDFWLSRNGHGAGYFDRGDERVFGRLQAAAGVYGETSVTFDGDHIYTN